MNEVSELTQYMHDIDMYTPLCSIKRNLMFAIMEEYIDLRNETYAGLIEENGRITGSHGPILFNGRKMDGLYRDDNVTALDESLHIRMEQWRLLQAETKRHLRLVENWIGAILNTCKSIADVNALLPAKYQPAALSNIEAYSPTMAARCRLLTTTLSREQIARFNFTHKSTLDALNAFELNKLTT